MPQGSILGPLLFNVYINSLPNAVKETRMILYADDAVLFCDASTRQELQIALEREFTEISNWYTDNRLTINVKKTKFMLAGSKRMLSLFEDFELQPNGTQIDRVQSFKYLGVTTDAKWSWKPHISNLLKKLGHRLSLFNRIFHMLDNRTRIAFYNGLVLPHLDYADTVWGDQPGLKSEMEKLQSFQNKFARKIKLGKMSSSEALRCLNWFPLAGRCLLHHCTTVENAIKGDILQHFESFKSTLRSSHVYNTRNGYLPRLPKPKTEFRKRASYFRFTNDWMSLPVFLRRPMPCTILKENLPRLLMDKYFLMM